MREKTLNLLGLMRRANAIAVGETNTGTAAKAGKAKLLLIAADASDNAKHRAENFMIGRNIIKIDLPFTKVELSDALGLPGCSMAAVTDMGFSNALVKLLNELSSGKYQVEGEELEKRYLKAERRKAESKAHERNKRIGKRRTKA